MMNFGFIRNPFLAILGALLILVQSIFAIEKCGTANDEEDHHYQFEVKVNQAIASTSTYLEANSKVSFTIATFLLLWVSKLFNHPQLLINTYRQYKAFFGHAYVFNPYYTYISALAP